jgi:hypothetical protein
MKNRLFRARRGKIAAFGGSLAHKTQTAGANGGLHGTMFRELRKMAVADKIKLPASVASVAAFNVTFTPQMQETLYKRVSVHIYFSKYFLSFYLACICSLRYFLCSSCLGNLTFDRIFFFFFEN